MYAHNANMIMNTFLNGQLFRVKMRSAKMPISLPTNPGKNNLFVMSINMK